MSLSKDTIDHIAHLARIGMSEEERERYRKDLSSVLAYFEKLEELRTDDVAPLLHSTGLQDVFRPDRARACDDAERTQILANVPDTKDGYIKVKAIL